VKAARRVRREAARKRPGFIQNEHGTSLGSPPYKVLASELRCRPEQCTAVVKAVLALHYLEHAPFAALRAA
jgi:hypothetical protein